MEDNGPPNIPLISRRDVHPTEFAWNRKTVDYVLLTVNEHEFLAAYEILKDPSKSFVEDLGPVYFGGVGKVEVALVRSRVGALNPSAAQENCGKAVHLIKPKGIICLGVCFGLLEEKQKLGDLLISKNIQSYSQVRVNPNGSRTPKSNSFLVNSELYKLFEDGQYGWDSQLSGRSVKVHTGTILSGPEFIDNADRRLELKRMYREALGGEMESEGLIGLGVPFIVCKSIGDWADGSTTKDWQTFCAKMSASFVKHVLESRKFQQVSTGIKGSHESDQSPAEGEPSSKKKDKTD